MMRKTFVTSDKAQGSDIEWMKKHVCMQYHKSTVQT